ncbi:MAG: VWA domain-containing protein [Oscillospiraceae bacterium]|nr:VWA domain-containing protein [Oscillospiraceae bacterium]
MKRFISLVLALVMMVCVIPFSFNAGAVNTKAKRYIVLVLDSSNEASFSSNGQIIYVAPSAITYVKTAATRFLTNISTSKDDNYVAVVSYEDTGNIVSDFSNQYDKLENEIENLSATKNVRDISEGLKVAQNLLDNIQDENAEKNIVLVSTGMTNNGNYSYSGYFDSNTIGNKWYRVATNVSLYAYANYAYKIAANIKEADISIYSIGLFQTMSDMPDEGKNIAEFFRLTASALATSKNHFYPVDDPDNLEFTFGEIADDINNLVVTGRFSDYTITVYLNAAGHYVSQVIIDGEKYAVAEKLISEEWANSYKGTDVKAIIYNGEIVSIVPYLTIRRDNNAFVHTYASFFSDVPADGSREAYSTTAHNEAISNGTEKKYLKQFKYEISDEKFADLLDWYYEFNTNAWGGDVNKILGIFGKNTLQKARDSVWGGSCFGISASAAMVFVGKSNLREATGRNGTFYEVTQTELPWSNSGIEDLINYYQLLQYVNCFDAAKKFDNDLNQQGFNDNLKRMIQCANSSESTGSPFLILMRYEHDETDGNGNVVGRSSGGHAVIGVASEGYNENGTYRIRVVDPNSRAYNYLNIYQNTSNGNYSFDFDNTYNSRNLNHTFQYIDFISIDELSLYDIDGSANDSSFTQNTLHISFDANDTITIIDLETGKKFVYVKGAVSGNMTVYDSYYYFKDMDDLSSNEVAYDIELGEKYQIITDGEININIGTDTVFYGCDVVGADTIEVNLSEGISLKGDNLDYNIYVSLGETADLINFSGVCENDLVVKIDEENSVDISGNNNYVSSAKLFDDEIMTKVSIDTLDDSFQISAKDRVLLFSDIIFALGDVDGDKKITAADARFALRRAVNLENYIVGSAEFIACDIDNDKSVTASDARKILRAAVGLEKL